MGSSSSGSSTKEIRVAGYIEDHHKSFLDIGWAYCIALDDLSPYASYQDIDTYDGFFSVGYTLSSFDSLFELFGKQLAGIDIDSFANDIFKDILGANESNAAIEADRDIYRDDLELTSVPQHCLNFRDINAVNSSSFVVGTANIECDILTKFSALKLKLQTELIPEAQKRLAGLLNHDKNIVTNFALALKRYYGDEQLASGMNYRQAYRDDLWALDVYNHMVPNLAAVSMVKNIKKQQEKRKRSLLSAVLLTLSYVVTGAVTGAAIGGYVGAIVGAVIGLIVGVAQTLLE